MGNPYKIKRHDRIYRRSTKSVVIRVVVIVVVSAFLFGVGWTLYGPVTEFIAAQSSRKPNTNTLGNSTQSATQDDSESSADTTEGTTGTNPSASPEAPQAATLGIGYMKAAYLSNDIVSNPTSFANALASAKLKGYDSIMLDLKQVGGMVNYKINYKPELDANYTSQTAFDLPSIASQIKEVGLTPVAVIHTFYDNLYSKVDKTAATMYQGGGYLWFDDSPQKGGKPWLNPYSQEAKAYINKIVDDAIASGFNDIVLGSVQFPQGYALDKIDYGENASTDKLQYLKQYVADMSLYAEGKGAVLAALLPASTMLGGEDIKYYGGDTSIIVGEKAVLDLKPSLLGNTFVNEQISIPTPQVDPYNTVKTLASAVKTKLPTSQISAVIQGSGLTEDVILAEIKGLEENGITSYIVENPPL